MLKTWLPRSKRYVTLPNNNRAANYNSINPSAPILTVTAPDPKTVVFKLKEPASYIMQRIANMITGELGSIYPRETDAGFDPRKGQIGTGGFMLDNYVPSASLAYKKNPDYWDKNAVFIDRLEMPIINQAAARDAQLKVGGIYAVGGLADIAAENVLQYKKDEPRLNLYSFVAPSNNVSYIQRFGWKDNEGKKAPVARRPCTPGDGHGHRPRHLHRRLLERVQLQQGRPGRRDRYTTRRWATSPA